VMRVLPLENEAINECWLSDKDRFSYEGLNSDDRLRTPMVKQGGEWKAVDWQTALDVVAQGLTDIVARHGPGAIGALVSPHSTLEELTLAGRFIRALGSDNIDFRLRQSDFRGNGGVPWLGMSIAELGQCDRVIVVGSFLRKDQPLIAQRLRQAARKGAEISMVHSVDDDWLINVKHKTIVPPSKLPLALAGIAAAAGASSEALAGIEPSDEAKAIAGSLKAGKKTAILLGNYAAQHPDFSQIHAIAQLVAQATGATLGFLPEAANSVGAHIAGALPQSGGMHAQAMLAEPRKAYVVMHAEPEFDFANAIAAREAMQQAELVVAMSPYDHPKAFADVILPISPFTETAGSFVNCEGRLQEFQGVVRPFAETRPGWKVWRVLGSMLRLDGFTAESVADVRASVAGDANAIRGKLDNATRVAIAKPRTDAAPVERVADVPIYFADPLVRRSGPLQRTKDAQPPKARLHRVTLSSVGVAEGAQVKVKQGKGEAVLTAVVDPGVPPGVVRIAAAHASTCNLEGLSGPVSLEKV
jgi:NADH-quinone oxidoreductase subunit G